MSRSDLAAPARREAELRSLNRRRHIRKRRSLVLSWLGGWLRRARRPQVEPLPSVSGDQVGVCFAGHATVLVRYAGLDIACDPMLGSRVKGVHRAMRPGLSPADMQDVGLILISHAHADHLHRPTLARLPRSATIVVPPRSARHVSDLGFARVVELGVGQSVRHRDVDIYTAAVRHGDRDHPALSYVLRGAGPSVYFCGDSGYFSGFAEIGRRFRPDVAVLPIAGYAPLSFRDRHMTPLDALYAFEDLQARVMIPIHHGAFALSYETLDDPARWLAQLVRERDLEAFVVDLAPGQSRVFVPPRARRATTTDGIPDADWSAEASAPVAHSELETDQPPAADDPASADDEDADAGTDADTDDVGADLARPVSTERATSQPAI